MQDMAIGEIRYNATSGAYEACVGINWQGRTYKYACAVPGSLMMADADVHRGLSKQARAMAGRNCGLHSIS